jgi:hypothetical protein
MVSKVRPLSSGSMAIEAIAGIFISPVGDAGYGADEEYLRGLSLRL